MSPSFVPCRGAGARAIPKLNRELSGDRGHALGCRSSAPSNRLDMRPVALAHTLRVAQTSVPLPPASLVPLPTAPLPTVPLPPALKSVTPLMITLLRNVAAAPPTALPAPLLPAPLLPANEPAAFLRALLTAPPAAALPPIALLAPPPTTALQPANEPAALLTALTAPPAAAPTAPPTALRVLVRCRVTFARESRVGA